MCWLLCSVLYITELNINQNKLGREHRELNLERRTNVRNLITMPHQSLNTSKWYMNQEVFVQGMWPPGNFKGWSHSPASKHEERKYPCRECDHQAPSKGNLTKHQKVIHKGKKFPCRKCEHQVTSHTTSAGNTWRNEVTI